jgi:hypothetical protein
VSLEERFRILGLIILERGEKLSLEQLRAFLEAAKRYGSRRKTARSSGSDPSRLGPQQGYGRLKRDIKGLVRRYLAKIDRAERRTRRA